MQSFAEYLAARGHDVTVVAEFPNHPHGVLPLAYRGRLLEDDRSNPYRVLRVWVRTSVEKTPRTRMSFYLSYMTLAMLVAPLAGRVDVVVATSPPLFAAAAGLAIARLQRVPFVLDVRDLWPAAAVSLDQLPSVRIARAAESLERLLYREASAVTAVTQPFCDHIDAVRGRPPATVLLPNGTLDSFLDAAPSREGRAGLGAPEDAFVVTFAGNFGIAQALGGVVEAAARAEQGIHFTLIGDGPVRQRLARRADELGLRNLTLVPQLPLERMPPLLASSDALLVTLSANPTFTGFVPSKLLDCMAVGRPVLLAAAGESSRLLERAGPASSRLPRIPTRSPARPRGSAPTPGSPPRWGHAAGRTRRHAPAPASPSGSRRCCSTSSTNESGGNRRAQRYPRATSRGPAAGAPGPRDDERGAPVGHERPARPGRSAGDGRPPPPRARRPPAARALGRSASGRRRSASSGPSCSRCS
jgi:colanic acid biosynthesis glycosyl transferase WcaI